MKLFKQAAALALTLTLALSLLSGCSKKADMCQMITGLPGDTVLATADGIELTADEVLYWLVYGADELMSYYSSYASYLGLPESPWDMPSEEMNLAETVMSDALRMAAMQKVVYHKAEQAGIVLTQENKDAAAQAVEATREQAALENLSLEEYLAQFIMTPAFYEWNLTCDQMYMALAEQNYGMGTEGYPTAEDAYAVYEAQGAYSVKHILMATVDVNTNTPLDEATVKEKEAQAAELLERLRASNEPEVLFDQLMNELSEDPGLLTNPTGYTFTTNSGVDPAFEQAALALEEGEISDVITGMSGYHIILRLPLEVDVEAYASEYINSKMTEEVVAWVDALDIQTNELCDALDVPTVYENAVEFRTTGTVTEKEPQQPDTSAPADASGDVSAPADTSAPAAS